MTDKGYFIRQEVMGSMVALDKEQQAALDALRAENERLRAIEQAAFAYVNTPIDDPDAGILYRELQQALRRPSHDE